jgi:phospholipid N-methyltransferase
MLGSAIPSSRYLISRILDQLDWGQITTAIEYGPGVGTFTRPILQRLRPDGNILAVELNREFADLLRADIRDPRLQVAHGSCADVETWIQTHHLRQADLILSGIPYTVLPGDLRHRILLASCNALARDGVFVVYQYTRAVLPDLQRVFSSVNDDFEPLNILPARVFFCRK